jgi:hypothetical protein
MTRVAKTGTCFVRCEYELVLCEKLESSYTFCLFLKDRDFTYEGICDEDKFGNNDFYIN